MRVRVRVCVRVRVAALALLAGVYRGAPLLARKSENYELKNEGGRAPAVAGSRRV